MVTRPKVGNWGRWGEDDERGLVNVITPEKLLRSLMLPTRGRVYSLAQEIAAQGVPMIEEGGIPLHLMLRDGGDFAAGEEATFGFKGATDYLVLRIHGHSTHIDALGHVWYGEQIYNGFDSNEIRSSGMNRCGIENLLGLVTRAILLDIPALKGREHLAGGYEITPEDLEEALASADVEVEAGDVVLIRTGWYRVFYEDRDAYFRSRPGIGRDAAQWLAERDVPVIGADTSGVEVRPYPQRTFAPVHQLVLRDYGVHLLEFLQLEELAQDGVSQCLFMAAPLRITGGTGSPINPLAIA